MHVWRTNSLFFLFLSFFLSLFLFFLLSFISFLFPCFLFCDSSQMVVTVVLASFSFFLPLLHTAKAPFFNACSGQILLFQPFTTFVQSGCTCRPPLDRLCATPHHQTKRTILFVSLPQHPFLLLCGFLLSPYPSWHAPSGFSSVLPILVVCHLNRTLPPKEPQQEPQNRFSLLPTTKPYPFTFDP